MIYKTIDKIIACLIAAELIYLVFIVATCFAPLLTYYNGLPLILIVVRIILRFTLGIIAVILFLKALPKAKWALSGYLTVSLLMDKYWVIKPNSEQYLKLVKEAQAMIESGSTHLITSKSVSVYPYWWVVAIYVLSLIYVFTLRKKV